jgi:hypothetical protein
MKIIVAIIAAIDFNGCVDDHTVKVARVEDVKVRPEKKYSLEDAREDLIIARKNLIHAIVESKAIPPLPHRLFRDIVEKLPDPELHTFEALHFSKEKLNSIPKDQLPEPVGDLKNKLALALGNEVVGALMAGIPLVREIIVASPIQLSLSMRALNLAQQVRINFSNHLVDELIEAIRVVPSKDSPEAFVDPKFLISPYLRTLISNLAREKSLDSLNALLDIILPNPLPVPLEIIESIKKLLGLHLAQDYRKLEALVHLVRLIDASNLPPDHVVSVAARNFFRRFNPFVAATVLAKQACVAAFSRLEPDPFYDDIDAYRALRKEDLSDTDRIEAQDKLIAAIPRDRIGLNVQELIDEYNRARYIVAKQRF